MCKSKCCCTPQKKSPRYLEPWLLLILRGNAFCGYELSDYMKKNDLILKEPDSGAVYRVLRKLESNNFVISDWQMQESGPAKRVYRITESGLELLSDWAAHLEAKIQFLSYFQKTYNNKPKN
ncbi:MAG: helix-turn-helix transcriptional regulator [Candidatus Delongbacteria bacterium]|nr:helix-turn-helix transcriptional regulator [Candidatus Delongbacteria bacterium]MCG2761486.1 helix-turn-helix transcriptional regulator [Candidatus Delongbacteria bacterium]